ncbi:hypothetical protein B0F90DRAFT_1301569 [Multifurca ochricompacta]|uniref:Chromosome transmission fidelity protein 8 n=1 Tax=Multifurca ochricompacta TaxID=376703 RepID=A0AAD4QNH7_9AGAM|nr:hypothetical protein B0F90DRAFT_1301569 [Multifurca ochricompacta]
MLIPLTLPTAAPSPNAQTFPPALAQLGPSEYFLIELQGELEVSGDKREQVVGCLTIDDDGKGKPTLRVGHHLLEGKIVNLPKPLAVLQRVRTPLPLSQPPETVADWDRDQDGDVEMRHNDDGSVRGENLAKAAVAETKVVTSVAEPEAAVVGVNWTTSYAIRTLVRKKIVFSKRPTPIVGLSAKTLAAAVSVPVTVSSEASVV